MRVYPNLQYRTLHIYSRNPDSWSRNLALDRKCHRRFSQTAEYKIIVGALSITPFEGMPLRTQRY
jgi:hypothetical protein